jgi:hypothetical protein
VIEADLVHDPLFHDQCHFRFPNFQVGATTPGSMPRQMRSNENAYLLSLFLVYQSWPLYFLTHVFYDTR